MRILSFSLAFSFFFYFCLGQKRQSIDSLKHELAIARHDTSRVLLLCSIGYEYRNFNADSGILFINQGLKLARQSKFLKGEVRALERLGANERVRGNLIQALDLLLKSLEIAEKNNFVYDIARALNGIALINFGINDYRKALNYHQKSLRLFETIKDKENSALLFSNIGQDYLRLNQMDSALYFGIKALNAEWYKNEKVRHDFQHIFMLLQLGDTYKKMGNDQLAFAYYQQAVQEGDKDDHRTRSETYYRLATYYKEKNHIDSCIYYAQKGLLEGELASIKRTIFFSSSLLSEIYEPINTKEALRYYKIASAAYDSLYGITKVQGLQKLFLEQQERQQKKEIERLAYETQLKQYAFLVGLGVLLAIAFILYRNNIREKKAKKLLQEQKEKVESTLTQLQSTQAQLIQKEKLASLGELTAGIAHEIQNPLNFVNNFSELSGELLEEMEEEIDKGNAKEVKAISSDLKQNLQKINHHGKRASSIVKGMLEHSRMGTGERVLTDLNILCDEYLRLSYHGMRAKNNQFNADYELITDPDLPKVNVVPQDIGRVLLNLINNAFYAAYESKKSQPKVIVSSASIALSDGSTVIIRVKDNGKGIPKENLAKIFQPFFTTKPTGEGTGLGLSLAYDIITKGHGGTIEVESVQGEGTTFSVQLPTV
ncbi:MAG: ATP-binding protein [Spirosomataceae bacterium]